MNKKYIYIATLWMLTFFNWSCEKKSLPFEELTDSKEGAMIFIAKAVNGIQKLTIFPYEKERKFKFGVGFGALGLPANDIYITLAEDTHVFDSLNAIRKLNGLEPYERFPQNVYEIDLLNLLIPKGETYSNLTTITYHPEEFESTKDYLLPLTITDASGYDLNAEAKTILIIAPKLEERPANTKGWVADASSFQGNNLENTGLASALLDGNINTIWHSRYSPTVDPYPHVINIDMQDSLYVTKVALTPRQNNATGPTKFKLEGSINGTNWIDLTGILTFDPGNINAQKYQIEPQYLKKIRLTLIEGRQASGVSFLSEFVVYTY